MNSSPTIQWHEHRDHPDEAAGKMIAIQFRQVTKIYGAARETTAIHAVRNVSLDVEKGETLCLMGTSGSGKSTLLRHVNRLIEPTSGKITVLGEDINRLSGKALRAWRASHIGMVFQHFGLLPHRTVRDNVALPLELRGVDPALRRDIAEQHLTMVQLGGWGDRYPQELSGGMQQRVGLARALAADPSILLMDEPFSALDPTIRSDLQQQFLDLARHRHMTTLLVTHDPIEAVRLGDRIAVMRAGTIVQVGTPSELIDQPADAWVESFFRDLRPSPQGVAFPAGQNSPKPAKEEKIVAPTKGSLWQALLWGPPALASAGRWQAFWLALLAEGILLAQMIIALADDSLVAVSLPAAALLCVRSGEAAWTRRPAGRHPRQAWSATALMIAVYGLISWRAAWGIGSSLLWQFPANHRLTIATAGLIDTTIAWLQLNLATAFVSFTIAIRTIIGAIEGLLGWLPWPVPAFVLIFIAWRAAGPAIALFAAAGVAYVGLFGFWEKAIASIALVGSAVVICILTGLPMGVLLARSPWAKRLISPMLDVMQTLPPFVYLIPAVAFFSVGKTPAVVATVIFALPPMIRLTALGIGDVSKSAVEAAVAHGASAWQTLLKVELPLAANSLMLGINQTIMMSLSMVVIAALIGAGGLGYDVTSALRNLQGGTGILAGLAIVVCALVPDRIIQIAAKRHRRWQGISPPD